MLKSWWLSIGDILQHRFRQGLIDDPYKRLAWYVILATIPVGIVGVLFDDAVESLFAGALYVPAFFLFVTGTILYLSQRMNSGEINLKNIGPKESLFMGLGQACAILPGLSRSGTTIATGLILGNKKESVAQFSFLMVLIPILGETLLNIIDMIQDPTLVGGVGFVPLAVGFLAAFLSGCFACKFMINLVKRGKLIYFAIYCAIIGAITIGFSIL